MRRESKNVRSLGESLSPDPVCLTFLHHLAQRSRRFPGSVVFSDVAAISVLDVFLGSIFAALSSPVIIIFFPERKHRVRFPEQPLVIEPMYFPSLNPGRFTRHSTEG